MPGNFGALCLSKPRARFIACEASTGEYVKGGRSNYWRLGQPGISGRYMTAMQKYAFAPKQTYASSVGANGVLAKIIASGASESKGFGPWHRLKTYISLSGKACISISLEHDKMRSYTRSER
jgi:hypothetical protein